jgi:Protein of unknown function (DUF2490)
MRTPARFFLLLWFLVYQAVAAPVHDVREWSKVDVTGAISPEFSDVRYEAFFETRNRETRLDFATGYRFSPLISVWNGFTWISPNDGSPEVYRPWQQLLWNVVERHPLLVLQSRTRLEELKREGQPEWLLRVRQRWRAAFPGKLGRFTPVIYDEVFFNCNQPAWVNTGIIDQNRLFVGVDTPSWHDTFVELGYLNQYIFNDPTPRMTHAILAYFMIILP